MPRRYYSSTAVATTLSGSINNSTTSVTVTALSGFPNTTPWTAIIDKDTASEEVVTVTAVAGTTLTVTRGVDGTSAVSHNAGAGFSHGVSARDFDEANSHVNDTTTDVHSQYVLKSLINAKGDLITGTADNTPAIQTVGSNGQMLMADSSATAGLRYVDPPANRNMVINGAMQVAQRGTSVTGITGTGYNTADRWRTVLDSLGTWTQSVEADGPTGSGLTKSMKVLCTTADSSPAAGDRLVIGQRLEGQDLQRIRKGTASAEPLTLSFWVKSNVTGTYVATLVDEDNNRLVAASYAVSASATWERKTITFPADSTGALDNDNAVSLQAQFWLGAGTTWTSGTLQTTWGANTAANTYVGGTNLAAATNNYWQITGVQLETGPVATPFEFEPYEATLRKCQRYYQRMKPGTDPFGWLTGFGSAASTTLLRVPFPLHVPLRATPSAVEYSSLKGVDAALNSSGAVTAASFTSTTDGNSPPLIGFTTTGLTQDRPYGITADNSTSAFLAVTAEL